jgi:hypothetical protein
LTSSYGGQVGVWPPAHRSGAPDPNVQFDFVIRFELEHRTKLAVFLAEHSRNVCNTTPHRASPTTVSGTLRMREMVVQ